jgi:membrane protein DedA with SNARE-associated domain
VGGITHFFTHHGLPVLFAAVLVESFGIPVPGETALIAFAVLAAEGHYSIWWVIVASSAGAIIGDNLGYWLIGRWGGRKLFERWGWLKQYADRVLPRAERFMGKHGGKTVFFGRFISILRYTVAWVAGLARMPWWEFLFWNALGGIAWSVAVGLGAYYAGKSVIDSIQRYGLYAAAGIVAVIVVGGLGLHVARRRLEDRI